MSSIQNHVISFYRDLFSKPFILNVDELDCSDVILSLVTNVENDVLTLISLETVIRELVFYLDPINSLGLDGFQGFFYYHC